MKKDRLLISFSGGRTSAYMTKRLLEEGGYKEIVVVFANTGQEDERTLDFVNNCDINYGFNTVWVEAVVNPEPRKGTKHKVVSFQTASRGGEPFVEVAGKYGVPNQISPHCTRELKQRPITSYVRSLGWKSGTYDLAIGIRSDEIDRMNSLAKEVGIVYPLIKWGIKKQDILDFWREQSFDFTIPEHRGNCLWCWKKSFRKLLTLANEDPKVFDFPKMLESNFSMRGATAKRNGIPMVLYRGHTSTTKLLEMAEENKHKPFVDEWFLSLQGGCEDSCEVFSSEEDVNTFLKDVSEC